jgi:hypothetical protein
MVDLGCYGKKFRGGRRKACRMLRREVEGKCE